MTELYRVGNHQPRNIYRGDTYIGAMFDEADAIDVVARLNSVPEVVDGAPSFIDSDNEQWYRVSCKGRNGVYTLEAKHDASVCNRFPGYHMTFDDVKSSFGPLRPVPPGWQQ